MILILTDKVNSDGYPASKSAGKLIMNAWRLFDIPFDRTDFMACIADDIKVNKTVFYTTYYNQFLENIEKYDVIVSFSELPNKFRKPENKLILPSVEDIKKRKYEPIAVREYYYFPHTLDQVTNDTKLERNGYKHKFYKFLENYHIYLK